MLLTSCEIHISFSTILRSRSMLGWTFCGSKYCQVIRPRNKLKHMMWAVENLPEVLSGGFEDVSWTDETSVPLESHRRHSYRKKGLPAVLKPHPKHPAKVHVWAGISKKKRTLIVTFDSTMDATLYIKIIQHGLLPFIQRTYPTSHRLMQNNDPKHTSKNVWEFFAQSGVNWWKTPPESPDFNPIENLWHELKEYIRREVKPSNKSELIAGIKSFWNTIDVQKCCRYINHLRKVIPHAIELEGAAIYWILNSLCYASYYWTMRFGMLWSQIDCLLHVHVYNKVCGCLSLRIYKGVPLSGKRTNKRPEESSGSQLKYMQGVYLTGDKQIHTCIYINIYIYIYICCINV